MKIFLNLSGPLFLAIFLVAIGTARIVSTYRHVSQVYDEPFHMLRGMHWQTGHAYVHSEHPPLGPLVFAFLPRLLGIEYGDAGSKLADGNSILYGNGEYLNTLVLFRIGNLLFFWLACFLLYQWLASRGRRLEGMMAIGFFTLCPTVLGHSGVATTDMPITAMLLCAVVFIERAMGKPTLAKWVVAGLATGLSLVAKLSALLFVPICLLVLLCFSPNISGLSKSKLRPIVNLIVYLVASFVVVWSVFGFTSGTLGSIRIKEYEFDGFSTWLSKVVVPFPEFIAGVVWAKSKLDAGHGDYFFGTAAEGGSTLFFPTVLAIKSPLVLLVFGLVSCVACWMKIAKRKSGWLEWPMLPLVISISLLLAVIPSSVNIGVRHLLPIYPFLSVLAADGMHRWLGCIGKGKILRAFTLIGFGTAVVWLLADSIASHPHYLSHFNEIAFGRPERIVLDSDLDWGQGVFELERTCRENDIERLQVYYFGTASIDKHDLPLEPSPEDSNYWIAISLTLLFRQTQFEEFRQKVPDAMVDGGSIWLYHIPRSRLLKASER